VAFGICPVAPGSDPFDVQKQEAAAGVIAGCRKAKHEQQAATQQVQAQAQQAVQADEAKIASFQKAFSACLEGKKYTVKY
jgi:hypothetical protein